MNQKLFLLLTIFAVLPVAAIAQDNALKPVAIRWVIGETGGGKDEDGERPRVVANKASNSAVSERILSVEKIAFEAVNKKRAEAGLRPLAWSDQLEAVARFHSVDMAEYDYFSHRSPSGKVVSDRADDAHIGNWRAIGENIAFNRGYQDPIAKAVDLWMNSPSHKNNMLSETWRESAIGVAIGEDGSYYFTQVFLTRK